MISTISNSKNMLGWVYKLYRLTQEALKSKNPETVNDIILAHIVSAFNANTGSLARVNSKNTALTLAAGIGIPAHVIGNKIDFGEGVLGFVAEEGEPLLLNGDITNHPKLAKLAAKRKNAKPSSSMCWPLSVDEKIVGVISVNRTDIAQPFSEKDLVNGEFIIQFIAVAVENTRLYVQHQDSLNELKQFNKAQNLWVDALNWINNSQEELERSASLDTFVKDALRHAKKITRSNKGALLVDSEKKGIMQCLISWGNIDDAEKKAFPAFFKRLLNHKKLDNSAPLSLSELFDKTEIPSYFQHGDFLVSLIQEAKIKRGVIFIGEKKNAQYDGHDRLLLGQFSNGIAQCLERYQLLISLRKANKKLHNEKKEQKILITRLEDAQNQLLQSEKMASIGQLAAGVAHEINNPIGYVNANLESMKDYVDNVLKLIKMYQESDDLINADPELYQRIVSLKENIDIEFLSEDLQNLVAESQEGISRVKNIVQNLKDFSHVDETEWQWSNLESGIDSTLNIAISEIKYKAEVVRKYENLPEIECIPSQLNQVFLNLLVNAAQSIPEKGIITITTCQDDDQSVLVKIRDNGGGIPEDKIQRIFEPFFTTKPVGEGTGLGLSLSYSIIERHNGEILVDSTLGEGTCFTIRLPINHVGKK